MESHLDGNLLSWHVKAMAGLPFTGSAYRAPDGVVVWIDPPDPGTHEQALLALGKPAHVLVTFRDHDRAVAEVAAQHGAKVWIPKGEGGSLSTVDVEYDEQTALPAGLRAIGLPAMGFGEHALIGEAYGRRFAFIGDAVFNHEAAPVPGLVKWLFFKQREGPLHMKRHYRGGDTAAAHAQLSKLLDEKLDALFLSHGRPIPADADRWLRACLGT